MEQEMAEGERSANFWREMIERQKQEQDNRDSSWRERVRSLPQEEQEDKGKGRGSIMPENQQVLTAEQAAWFENLQYASRNAGREQDQGLER